MSNLETILTQIRGFSVFVHGQIIPIFLSFSLTRFPDFVSYQSVPPKAGSVPMCEIDDLHTRSWDLSINMTQHNEKKHFRNFNYSFILAVIQIITIN